MPVADPHQAAQCKSTIYSKSLDRLKLKCWHALQGLKVRAFKSRGISEIRAGDRLKQQHSGLVAVEHGKLACIELQ